MLESVETCCFAELLHKTMEAYFILWKRCYNEDIMSATSFSINVICNRAQIVTFLYRTYN